MQAQGDSTDDEENGHMEVILTSYMLSNLLIVKELMPLGRIRPGQRLAQKIVDSPSGKA